MWNDANKPACTINSQEGDTATIYTHTASPQATHRQLVRACTCSVAAIQQLTVFQNIVFFSFPIQHTEWRGVFRNNRSRYSVVCTIWIALLYFTILTFYVRNGFYVHTIVLYPHTNSVYSESWENMSLGFQFALQNFPKSSMQMLLFYQRRCRYELTVSNLIVAAYRQTSIIMSVTSLSVPR
jgi:hypothetical protein